jgi:predicted HicB family RNase H-like nuclease
MKRNSHKGFIPKFFLDSTKNIIRGKVLNTKDTITFHGRTVTEAWDAFRDSVDDYLAFCKELGVEPEKPFSGNILVRVTPETHRRLSLRAQLRGISVNALITRTLDRAVGRDPVQRGTMLDLATIKEQARVAARKKKPKPTIAKTKVKSGTA